MEIEVQKGERRFDAGLGRMSGARVLVTGGLGFIGSNVVHRCLELGARVTIYDCLDPWSGGNMRNVSDLGNDVEIVLNDIRNFDGLCGCIRGHDFLFNCAAYTSHPNSMKEPQIDIDVNCKGVINVLEAARRFNPEVKIVHVGTSTQVGRMLHSPIDETHPEFPKEIYSANKMVSEKYVLIYGNAYRMRTSVVRLSNTFGPRSNIKNPDLGFINYFVGLALQGREITVFGEGGQLRNVTYVDDAVEALVLAAVRDESEGGVFFAVGDRQYSVREIAEAISERVGGHVRFVEWPRDREMIEIGDAVISNEKIKRTLGWSPRWGLPEGLSRTREYFSTCLKDYLR